LTAINVHGELVCGRISSTVVLTSDRSFW
jgi:hypothetical protein